MATQAQIQANNRNSNTNSSIESILASLGERYLNGQLTDDTIAGIDAALAGISTPSFSGMDFSPWKPLLSVIRDNSYTRENAIKDSQGFINQIFADYRNSLPTIYKNARGTGIYDDTTSQLLANDAYAAAVAKGQANLFQNIMQYANARKLQLDPVMQLMNGMVADAGNVRSAQASVSNNHNNILAQLLSARGQATASGKNANRQNNVQTAAAIYDLIRKLGGQQGSTNVPSNDTTNAIGSEWDMPPNPDYGNGTTNQPAYPTSWGGGTYNDDYMYY